MKPLIEVYVRSVSPYVDYELTREMSQHGFCDPDMATKAGEMISQFNKVKGRVFAEDDWTVLQRLAEAVGRIDGEVRLYDVSRVSGRLRALSRGVVKTPLIVMNGEKHDGVAKCLDALDRSCSKKP